MPISRRKTSAYNGSMIASPWLLALAIALPLTLILADRLRIWAPTFGLVDSSDRRKPHCGDVPVGGLAVIVGSVVGLIPLLIQAPSLGWWIAGALVASVVGLVDDRLSLSPLVKLGAHAIAAVLALPYGLDVHAVAIFGWEVQLGIAADLFVGMWIVGMTNAFNLTDGLDGLACGAAVVLALSCGIMGAVSSDGQALTIGCALGGSALGFLWFNRHPAQVFLGDGGSYFLGFLLALATLRAGNPAVSSAMPLDALAIIWGYPIVDTLWAVVRRMKAKRPLLSPDRAHIHHRLLSAVGRYRTSVWALYGGFVLLAVVGVAVWTLGR